MYEKATTPVYLATAKISDVLSRDYTNTRSERNSSRRAAKRRMEAKKFHSEFLLTKPRSLTAHYVPKKSGFLPGELHARKNCAAPRARDAGKRRGRIRVDVVVCALRSLDAFSVHRMHRERERERERERGGGIQMGPLWPKGKAEQTSRLSMRPGSARKRVRIELDGTREKKGRRVCRWWPEFCQNLVLY